jgi:hypothetical protein
MADTTAIRCLGNMLVVNDGQRGIVIDLGHFSHIDIMEFACQMRAGRPYTICGLVDFNKLRVGINANSMTCDTTRVVVFNQSGRFDIPPDSRDALYTVLYANAAERGRQLRAW